MDIHYEAQPSSVVSVPVASCGGRMPECTSTCERFTFFEIGAVRRLRGVFCPCLNSVEPRKPACELESLEAS